MATAIVNRFEAETTALNLEVEKYCRGGFSNDHCRHNFLELVKPSSFEQVPTIIEKQTTKLASEGKNGSVLCRKMNK